MRETFSSYLSKMVEKTKDLLTHPSAEQTTQDQETAANSPQGKLTVSQSEKEGSTLLAVKKSKKRRVPFVALALVLLFTSLCVIAAFGLRPVALANKLTALDSSATPASVPPDQSVSFLISEGNAVLAPSVTCPNASDTYESVVSKDTLCWDQDDFTFGDRDITCIVNPQYSTHPSALNTTITLGSTVQASLSLALPAATSLNQNTCTDNSQCVSDNSSYTDFATPSAVQIHGQTAGDDILCANSSCTRDNTGSTTECGDPAGKQWNYDRFGCQMVDTTFHAEGPGSRTNHWKVTGAAINPTSYDPNGALYLPTINLTETAHNTIDAGSTNTYPSCENSGHRWICPNADGGKTPNVVVYQEEGNFTADKNKNLVLVAVAYVPKLMGTKSTQAIAQAGTVAGGAIVAGGGMAMNVV